MHLLGQRPAQAADAACTFVRAMSPAQACIGDGIQLRQVIINLLRNAEDAIAAAGAGPREIRIVSREPDAAHMSLAIRDSGSGVDEKPSSNGSSSTS